jgi:FMN phosphatase YigB (HAD superfamily)
LSKIFSFDVYETSLFREIGCPKAIFFKLGKILKNDGLINYDPSLFQSLRIEAERQAFREYNFFNLYDIYKHFNRLNPNDIKISNSFLEQELLLEQKICHPNPDILSKICSARNNGYKIAHVSDMYLPKSFIEELLLENGIMKKGDPLYVSNHDKAAKGDGSMFLKISKDLGVPLSRISHIGNCYQADYLGAKKVGVHATHYPYGNSTKKEKELNNLASFTDGLSSYWSGISRIGRLSTTNSSNRSNEFEILEQIACSVASPLLCSYVHWALNQAVRDKVDNLFFIARDGQILWEIAKNIQYENPSFKSLNLKYIYGSREAWRAPSIIELDDFTLNWILNDHPNLTPKCIYGRVGLTEDFFSSTSNNPLSKFELENLIPLSLHPKIRDWLTSSEVSVIILQESKKKRELLLKYFEQEGVFDGNSAFVEIGCTGTTQHALHRMLHYLDIPTPLNYFFGLADSELISEGFKSKAFFYDQRKESGIRSSPEFNFFVLLETFCMANHGRTLAYEQKGEKVEPTLAYKAKYFMGKKWEEFFREKVISTAVAYSKAKINFDTTTSLLMCSEIIRQFWQHPSLYESAVWGSHLKEHDPTNKVLTPLAKSLTLKDFKKCYNSQELTLSWWPAAQARKSNFFTIHILKSAIQLSLLKNFLKIKLGMIKKVFLT